MWSIEQLYIELGLIPRTYKSFDFWQKKIKISHKKLKKSWLKFYNCIYLPDLTLMIFTFFSFQEIPRSHLKCSSILGSLAKRPREDQLILVSICVSAALTLGLIVFVAVHCRRQMKSCFDPRGLVSIENNNPNNGATNFSWLGFNLFLHTTVVCKKVHKIGLYGVKWP